MNTETKNMEVKEEIQFSKFQQVILKTLLVCHIVVVGYYMYLSHKINNDGVWNSYVMSYTDAKEHKLSVSSYIAYLFWVPTDTPGDNPRVVTEEGDYLGGWGYLGMFVVVILFLIWEVISILLIESKTLKEKFIFATVLLIMMIWLITSTIKIQAFLPG